MRIVNVLVDRHVSDDDVAMIKAELASANLTADVRAAPPSRSIADVTWLVLAYLPLQHFFGRLAEDAADDAHRRLKAFADRVLRRKSAEKPKPVMILVDEDTGVRIVLEPDLPAESYRQLLTFDLTAVRRGSLHYDLERRRWRSELDEAYGPP